MPISAQRRREKYSSAWFVQAVKAVGVLMVDPLHFEALVQAIPRRGLPPRRPRSHLRHNDPHLKPTIPAAFAVVDPVTPACFPMAIGELVLVAMDIDESVDPSLSRTA
jgi:hypothetical protein